MNGLSKGAMVAPPAHTDFMQLSAPFPGMNLADAAAKVLGHRATQTTATVVALLLLCWALAQGTWKLWQPTTPVVERASSTGAVADLNALLSARPFGSAPAAPVADDARVARSNLNISLTGVAARSIGGCALLVVQGQPESAYCAGEEITPGVRLESVQADRIVILRNGVREAVLMKDAESTSGAVASAPVQPVVQSLGADRQVVDRRQLQRQIGRPEFLSQALIVPNPGGGFLVREIQSGSLYEKLGLHPGDIIRTVNGQPLASMDDVMRLYQQFGTAERVTVDVQRQGRSETLYYDMR
jgi:general secretion pathway protein C